MILGQSPKICMPKYYCEYCNIYLTHDALHVRRDHNKGWKHIKNVQTHFMKHVDQMQMELEEIYRGYREIGDTPPIPPGTVSDAIMSRIRSIPPPPRPKFPAVRRGKTLYSDNR
jgi:U1 small nuclear ribonucleoprotein C